MSPIQMTCVDRDALTRFTLNALSAMGVPQKEAELFAGALIFSELRFHPGQHQGVSRLVRYRERIAAGEMDPAAPFEIVKQSPALALVDAHNGIGTIAGQKAMDLAIEKAKISGIGTVIVRNSTHYGSSAVHACRALEQGCIGIAYTNAGPEMAPWGAREGAIGTNPWAIAAPTDMGFPAVLDIALTTAGKGMMRWFEREGRPMPIDWALTPDGEETTDPAAAKDGALLGIGGYKGYGLSFMTDVLTGVLGGGGFGLTPYADPRRLDVSHSFTAIDIEWFMPRAEFETRMGEFSRMCKSRALRPGVDEVLIPGEQEARRVAAKSGEGVPVDDTVIAELRKLAEDLGIEPFPETLGAYERATL